MATFGVTTTNALGAASQLGQYQYPNLNPNPNTGMAGIPQELIDQLMGRQQAQQWQATATAASSAAEWQMKYEHMEHMKGEQAPMSPEDELRAAINKAVGQMKG